MYVIRDHHNLNINSKNKEKRRSSKTFVGLYSKKLIENGANESFYKFFKIK